MSCLFVLFRIYFIGANAKKRGAVGTTTAANGTGANLNNYFDNEQGSYIHIPHDHISYRYEVLKIIGKGSFGQVVKAYDHKLRDHVALKMVRNEKRKKILFNIYSGLLSTHNFRISPTSSRRNSYSSAFT